MNELIEVKELPKGIEGFLSEFKPVTKVKWDFDKRAYVIDNSTEVLDKQKAGFEKFKDAIREVYMFGETLMKRTPKFCLALMNIFNGLQYVEDDNNPGYSYQKELNVKPSMEDYSQRGENFKMIISKLGVSESTAYRYKDLANFVDEETEDFYKEFKGYSLSLLSEIWTFAAKKWLTSKKDLIKLSKLIPASTSVDEMRLYRKAREELNTWGESLFKNYTYAQRDELEKKPLPKVLEVYNDLVQKREAKKLEATMSGVQTVAKEDKSAKVLPVLDEITVKKEEYQKITALAKRAENIGKCDGCKHNGTNLNKCRCCRRYESLKDLFEN